MMMEALSETQHELVSGYTMFDVCQMFSCAQVESWSSKVTTRLEEVERTSTEYCTAVTADVQGLDDFMGASTSSQVRGSPSQTIITFHIPYHAAQ